MGLFDGFTQTVADFRKLTPTELKRLAGAKMSDLVLQEVARAKTRVAVLSTNQFALEYVELQDLKRHAFDLA